LNGETDLTKLIRTMRPELNQGEFVFCTFDSLQPALALNPICIFHEKEGVTAILSKTQADAAKISYSSTFSWITLTVHSSLEAVGLTAAFSTALANANISCNVVAAFHHDHIFVPTKDAVRAMDVLENLAASI